LAAVVAVGVGDESGVAVTVGLGSGVAVAVGSGEVDHVPELMEQRALRSRGAR